MSSIETNGAITGQLPVPLNNGFGKIILVDDHVEGRPALQKSAERPRPEKGVTKNGPGNFIG